MMKVINSRGIPFNVRVVSKGMRYGRDDLLIFDDADPIVEFYDARDVGGGFGTRGQMICSYCVSTLRESAKELMRSGLCLHAGEPDWFVDAAAMSKVLRIPAITSKSTHSPGRKPATRRGSRS
jgi:hypothetical protein